MAPGISITAGARNAHGMARATDKQRDNSRAEGAGKASNNNPHASKHSLHTRANINHPRAGP